MGSEIKGKEGSILRFLLWLVRKTRGPWKDEGRMSTTLWGILNSMSTCQNPTLSLEAQLEATSYGKSPSPYKGSPYPLGAMPWPVTSPVA